jgi:hypothetical protein
MTQLRDDSVLCIFQYSLVIDLCRFVALSYQVVSFYKEGIVFILVPLSLLFCGISVQVRCMVSLFFLATVYFSKQTRVISSVFSTSGLFLVYSISAIENACKTNYRYQIFEK